MPYDPRTLFRNEAIEWAALTDVLNARPHEPLTAGGDPWHSAEVYAHLARWFDRAACDLQALAAAREAPVAEDAEALNATWRREDSGLSFAAARDRAMGARWRLLTIAAETPRSRWNKAFVETFHAATRTHYREHLDAVALLVG